MSNDATAAAAAAAGAAEAEPMDKAWPRQRRGVDKSEPSVLVDIIGWPTRGWHILQQLRTGLGWDGICKIKREQRIGHNWLSLCKQRKT